MTERTSAHPGAAHQSPSSIRPVDFDAQARPPFDATSHKLWQWGVVGGVFVCVVAVLALKLSTLDTSAGSDAPHLHLYIEQGGYLTPREPDALAYAGDKLQMTYSSRDDRFLAVLHTDAQHGVRVYTPSPSASAQLVRAGDDVTFGSNVQLDDRPGVEQLLAVFCPKPFDTQPLVVSLLTQGKLPAQPQCQVDVVQLRKTLAHH